MSGSVSNAAVWANADVFIAPTTAITPVNATTGDPDGSAFSAAWEFAGLLNGDDGFGESRAIESSDFYAWGGILVATTRRNFKLTRTFTCLEDNDVVFSIAWPGSTVTFTGSNYTGQIAVPDLQHKFKVAFEVETGSIIKRVVSKNYAQVDEVGEVSEGESGLATRPFTVAIYPDDAGVLFDTYKGARA